MPKNPKNIIKRGKIYYLRQVVGGKSVWKSLRTDRQDEAKRRAALIKQELKAKRIKEPKQPIASGSQTSFGEFGPRWIDEYVQQRRNSKGTFLAQQRLRDFLDPILENLELAAIQVPELRAVRAHCESEGLSAQSVAHVLADLRCLLRYAVECGLLMKSPSFRMVRPAIPEAAPKRLSKDQLRAILGSQTERGRFAIRLAVLTGIRWGELHRLQWRHVVWEPKPHLVLEQTKSKKIRRVPLVPEAVDLLCQEFKKTNSVFVLRLRMKNPCSLYANGEKKCGVKWHFHQLRHTFACNWLEAGGSKETLQKILGHSTIRLTERYGDLSDEAVFCEADRIASGSKSGSSPVEPQPPNVVTSFAT